MPSLKTVAAKGIAWNVASNLTKQILNFIIGVVMARLLSPAEFGLVGMVTVFLGFLNLFIDQGMGAAIIQRRQLDDLHLDSIFWMNVAAGAGMTVVVAAAGGWIADFYGQPILRPLVNLISINFIFSSLNVVPIALLDRQVAFRKHAIVNAVAVSTAGCVGIVLALKGFGVWSLVWEAVALTAMNAVTLWSLCPWRPRFRFSVSAAKDVLGFSLNLLGFNIANYWIRSFDNLLIGRFVGAAALGVYAKAYGLMMLPLTQISWVLSRVTFPVLASIQDDLPRVKRAYLLSIQTIAFFTFPLMTGLLAVSDSFVFTVFGDKWGGVIPILRILCVAGLLDSVTTTVGSLYKLSGRTDVQFKWGLCEAALLIPGFIIGLRWGAEGVAWAYLIVNLIVWYPGWTVPGRLIGLKFGEMMSGLVAPFLCAAVMGALVWLAGLSLPADWPQGARLAAQVPLGIAVYAFLAHTLKLDGYREIRSLLK